MTSLAEIPQQILDSADTERMILWLRTLPCTESVRHSLLRKFSSITLVKLTRQNYLEAGYGAPEPHATPQP